jgi:hypothetical protein
MFDGCRNCISYFTCTLKAETASPKEHAYTSLYQRYHQAIARNPIATKPGGFRIAPPDDVGGSFEEMQKKRFGELEQ